MGPSPLYQPEQFLHLLIYIYVCVGECVCEYVCVYIYIYVREGNGTPLQHSCLENPMDRGAWWATVQGAAELDVT